jgi:AcrR family transcriptional regulator
MLFFVADTMEKKEARAERILDVAGELLGDHGYRRVTVEDVAEAAGIGKGTIYLHWKTREALFVAVLLRDFLGAMDELIAGLRADPQAVLLRRVTRAQFRQIMSRPLLRAIYTEDSELLGKLSTGLRKTLDPRHHTAFDEYLTLLGEHGLLRDDFTISQAAQAFRAIFRGFLLAEDATEDVLGEVIARALEPAGTVELNVPVPVAERAVALFEESVAADRAVLRRAY